VPKGQRVWPRVFSCRIAVSLVTARRAGSAPNALLLARPVALVLINGRPEDNLQATCDAHRRESAAASAPLAFDVGERRRVASAFETIAR